MLEFRLEFLVIELEELFKRTNSHKVEEEELAERQPVLLVPKGPEKIVKRPKLMPVDVFLVRMRVVQLVNQ